MRRGEASDGRHLQLLKAICRLLPKDCREEQLAEWRDEIRCAEERGLPASRRALSIATRSVPRLAWRARRPSRALRVAPKAVVGGLEEGLPRYLRRSWALTAGRADRTKALAIATFVLLIDLGSKAVVSNSVTLFERQHPLPYLTIFHLHNPGLSLTFIDGGFYMPVAVALIGGCLILLNVICGPPEPRLWLVIGLMVGGMLGNLSERLYVGHVTDFLQVGSVPAVFNFADLAIALAVLLAVLPRFGRSRPTEDRSFRGVVAESSLP
ncbi:MAG TPA: signal peptidase II [Polyangia bacterium]|nr:signal peptidase II [Polyangia bacterium]